MGIDEPVLSDNNTDEELDDEEISGMEVINETFGEGTNQKVLLVSRGVSLKNIVEISR